MPAYFDKYFWTHGRGRHKGVNCNSMAPGHNDKTTMDIKMGRISYGSTECRCGTVPKVATNNNRNILLKCTDTTLVPPKFISYKHMVLNKSIKITTLKSDTGTTRNYIRGQDIIILKTQNQQPPAPYSTSPTTTLFNQHSLDIYLSQFYNKKTQNSTHIKT